MPVYEYQCLTCSKHLEVMQKFSDEPLRTCPECCGDLKKLISHTSFVLKGSGWYVTDYASPDRKKAMETEKKPADAPPSESKAEPKPETKTETKKETVPAG